MRTIEISVKKLAHLFEDPHFLEDPLSSGQSGMKRAFEQVSEMTVEELSDSSLTLKIKVEEKENWDKSEIIPELIKTYCMGKAADLDREVRQIQKMGRIYLLPGILYLALCLGISAIFTNFEPVTSTLPEWLSTLISEGALITGWVALWRPFETIVYDWREPKKASLKWVKLGESEIEVE